MTTPTAPDPAAALLANRRAAALLAAWHGNDRDGVRAVLAELATSLESTYLIFALVTAAELLGERVFGADGWRQFLADHRDSFDLAAWAAELRTDDDDTENG
jgi:hypothetical protein